jgi:N-dimethylarginine dimethylaminohydrolase
MLREIVLGKDVKYFLEVPLPFGHIHIDGVFMVLDRELALVYPESFRVFPCRLYEDGRSDPRHVMFEEFLDERRIKTIAINRGEREAGHLNVVVTKRGQAAIGFDTAKRVAAEMTRYGWRLVSFPAEELFKGNGGAHCMTCPVDVG